MINLPPIPKDELARLTPGMRRWVLSVSEAFNDARELTVTQDADGTLASVNAKLNELLAALRVRRGL